MTQGNVEHPDKTFIGKAKRGFDFLGYWLRPGEIGIAGGTIANRNERIARLYEQGADNDSIGEYIKRWWQWVIAGMGELCCGWKEEIKKGRASKDPAQLKVRG